MRISKAGAGVCGGLLLAAIAPVNAGSVDAKLLDMLKANGSITAAQHAELSADLAKEASEEKLAAKNQVSETDFVAFTQRAGWAANTRLTGDMRVRHDYINIEDEAKSDGRDKDRQRIRARLGAFAQVNPEVEAGIQVASGNSGDARSTNQDMNDYFSKKSVWLDLAYIDYHPAAVPGFKGFAGKMKQPWVAVGDAAWDGDINPEGFAATYSKKFGSTTLFGSTGYFVLKDNVDGEGVEWQHDLNLAALQIGASFDAGDDVRIMLGGSVNSFSNDKYASTSSFRTNGNTTDKFGLYELFSQVDLIGLPLPLSVYGQYIQNAEAEDFGVYQDGDQDTAWLVGFRTTIEGFSIDYNYRDVQNNAVVGGFTDSDFASGYTGSSGHKLKLKYDFLKNLSGALSYFNTESDWASRNEPEDAAADTIMIDLEAKF